MRGSSVVVLLIVAVLCASCRKEREEITGIDWDSWKGDRNGCLMKRQAYQGELERQKDRLKSMSEMEIVDLMGRPDETELLERNQKFFKYFLSGGPGCLAASAESASAWLTIRFNAVGLAKEVMIQSELPEIRDHKRSGITGIDWNSWKADRNGCLMNREVQADTLVTQRDLLKSLSEKEIVELMGRPDETKLLEGNQKFFKYFIWGGPGCVDVTSDGASMWLLITFDAVGLAEEVDIQGETPERE